MIDIVGYSQDRRDEVVDLILAIQRDEFAFAIRAEDQPDLLDVGSFYLSGAGGFWLALHGGEVVGTIALKDIGNHQCALRKMFVKAAFRGKEHAVAARLLERLVQSSLRKQVKELWLGTTEKFVAAHRFYEKNGFVQVAAASLPQAFPRMAVDTRFYCRTLP